MKALVVYYSRTGNTKRVGEMIAEKLHCDCEEILDTKDWSGAMGYVKAGRGGMKKELTELKPTTKDPSKYELVIIGSPCWAWNMAVPVRTYITNNKDKFKKIAFFMTHGGNPGKSFPEMESLSGKSPEATLEVLDKDVKNTDFSPKVDDFVRGLTRK